jgi:hypothetical protein
MADHLDHASDHLAIGHCAIEIEQTRNSTHLPETPLYQSVQRECQRAALVFPARCG